jgi:hypothetical protein
VSTASSIGDHNFVNAVNWVGGRMCATAISNPFQFASSQYHNVQLGNRRYQRE